MTAQPAGQGAGARSLDAAILRIFAGPDRPVGVGLLVADDLALTCAHVVTTALGIADGAQPPTNAQVEIDLPLLGTGRGTTAGIERWAPTQDVAVLRLAEPVAGARPMRLVNQPENLEDLWGHPARAFGVPAGHPGGVWHSGVLRAGQAEGWVEVDRDGEGHRIAPGFSGSPVWDDTLAGVVGIVVVAERGQTPAGGLIPTSRLLEAWPGLRDLIKAPSPFRGLSAFRESDTDVFYGRVQESESLAVTVAAGRWTTLIGPSGCGKSSLVQAGVLPRLRAAGYLPLVMRPSVGSSPLTALAAALLPLREPPALSGTDQDERREKLTTLLQRPGALADIVPGLFTSDSVDNSGYSRLLIVIDQFEELLSRPAAEIDALAGALLGEDLPDCVRVLVTLRADHLEAVLTHPRLQAVVSRPPELLMPMGVEQLRAAITAPVDAVPGVRYEHHLDERILADAGADAGALPLLEFTLDMLWQRQHGGMLTHQAYDALGGVSGALRAHADREWELYRRSAEYDAVAARGLLTKLVRLPIGSAAATRRAAQRGELTENEWRLAQRLAAARLLVTGRSAEGRETVELAHEALITTWSELEARVAADRAFLQWRESLRHDVERWTAGNHAADLLPTKSALAAAQQWLPARAAEMGEPERDYLERGRARHHARKRRRRAVIGAVSTLILVAGAAGVITVRTHQDAAQKAAVVRSGTLAKYAQDLVPTDPGLAAQLAVASYRNAPTQDATDALNTALQTPLLDNTLTTTNGDVDRITTQADGPLAAAVDQHGTVHVMNLGAAPAPAPTLTLHTAGLTGIALAPHSPLLAAECSTPGLCLWNLADPAHPALEAHLPNPTPVHGQITSMTISPDGTLLAAASETGHSLLWSIAEPTHPRFLTELPNPAKSPLIASVAFAPSGTLLAESIEGGATRLWSLSNQAAPTSLATIASGYQYIAINPAGTVLAGANDTSVDLWDIHDPTAPTPITYAGPDTSATQDSQTLAFSPDGHTLAYGGTAVDVGNAGLCLLDLTAVAENPSTGPICMSTGFATLAMAYTRDGALLTGGLDATVRLWRASPAVVAGANGYGVDVPLAISDDGHLMAGAISSTDTGNASAVGIWNLAAPEGPTLEATLPPSSAGTGATFIGTNVVLSIANDRTVQLWNISDPHHPRQTASLGTCSAVMSGLHNISFTPARSIVAVLGDGGALNLWHVTQSGTATLLGSLTDPAGANGPGGVLQQGDTAYMTTPTGIDWWDITEPTHPAETGSSPLRKVNVSASEGDATTLFAAQSPSDPVAGGATLNLYNLHNGRVQSMATVSRHIGTFLGLSADGRLLAASAPAGNELTIFSTADARAPKPASSIITAYDIFGVAFSANDDLMADWNVQSVQLWDTRNPDEPVLVGSFAPVHNDVGTNLNETIDAVGFTPDGRLQITAAAAGPSLAYLFATDSQRSVDQLCSITTNPITLAQWKQYAPGVPYQNPCPR